MLQVKADVMAKEEIIPGVFILTLVSPEISRIARPGQFVHIMCGQNESFILRRPFSIHRIVSGRAFEIIFQVVGKGTEVLSRVKIHDTLDVIGPLGTSFKYSERIRTALLVAGGIGAAPLIFLAEELTNLHVRFHTMLGAQTRLKLLRYMDFKRMGKQTLAATDDGSFGHHGTVLDLLNRNLYHLRPDIIYACGPEPMLAKIAETTEEFGVECQVSVEAKMACGIGVCLGCACVTREGYKMVCKDGPVFDSRDIIWGKHALKQTPPVGSGISTNDIPDGD